MIPPTIGANARNPAVADPLPEISCPGTSDWIQLPSYQSGADISVNAGRLHRLIPPWKLDSFRLATTRIVYRNLDLDCNPFHTIRWNSSSIAFGDSLAPRSSHHFRSDSRFPASACERASSSL